MTTKASTYSYSLSGDPLIDSITNGFYWALDSSKTINWSISNGFNGESWNNAGSVIKEVAIAFKTLSYYIDANFNYTDYFVNPADAATVSNINISLDSEYVFTRNQYVWAIGNFPTTFSDTSYKGQAGDIYLNVQSQANHLPSYAPGSAGFALLLHEIGHTLGLKHTHDNGGTGRPTFAGLGAQSLDHDWFSIMSYNDDYAWNQLAWNPATPMALDCLGLMYIYGPNPYTNAGPTIHTITRTNFYETLWDAGGTDTLDFSASNEGWAASLQLFTDPTLNIKVGLATPTADTHLSAPRSLDWLLGTYENMIGSNYSDTLEGNDETNFIKGNGGNDSIDGGAGLDTCVYDKTAANYTITASGNQVTIKDNSGTEGTDTLQNVERLHFSDKTIALDVEGNAGQVYRVYQAAFNRTPDKSGLKYWINAMDNGQTLKQVAAGFINSSEFKTAYGAAPTAAQFVSKLYNNVLHRAPEPSGYDYWLNQVGSGAVAKTDALTYFSESPENKVGVIGFIQNGIDIT